MGKATPITIPASEPTNPMNKLSMRNNWRMKPDKRAQAFHGADFLEAFRHRHQQGVGDADDRDQQGNHHHPIHCVCCSLARLFAVLFAPALSPRCRRRNRAAAALPANVRSVFESITASCFIPLVSAGKAVGQSLPSPSRISRSLPAPAWRDPVPARYCRQGDADGIQVISPRTAASFAAAIFFRKVRSTSLM